MALTDNLDAYWKLDGNNTEEINANSGSDTNVTYSSGNGKIIQGAGMAGTGYIALTNAAALRPTGDFTSAAWVKTSNTGFNAFFCSSSQPSGFNGFRYITNNSHIALTYDGGTTAEGSTNIADGNFHYLVVTVTGTTLQFYVDGATEGSGVSITHPTYNGSNYCIIGGYNNTGTDVASFDGAIDELALWSRALSGAEITSLYNSGAGNQYPFSTAYSLAAEVGSFTLTGNNASFNRTIGMTAGTGVFTLTGIDTGLSYGRTLTAGTGSFLLTGNDAAFTKGTHLAAGTGVFTLTGNDALFISGKNLTAETGSFVITWPDVGVTTTAFSYETKPTTSWTDDSKPSSVWVNDSL